MGVGVAGSAAGRRTAHEYVKESLRRAILSGAIPGGTRLVQAEVASELKVSTTPVREAMRDLATEGLIRLDPHRGAIVHEMSWNEIADITSVLMLLEPEAMRQAAKSVTDDTLSEAGDLKDLLARESSPERWADLNREFFTVLVRDIESACLIDILRSLRERAALYVSRAIAGELIQTSDVNRQLDELLTAVRSRDGVAAARLSKRHMDARVRTIKSNLDART